MGDVEVGFIHSSKFITDESAVHVWLRRLENVGKRVLFVGDSGTVVAAEIDVDVEFAGGGVDVIICVDGVEEHEVGSFVCCNTFVTGELGVWGYGERSEGITYCFPSDLRRTKNLVLECSSNMRMSITGFEMSLRSM